MNRTVPPSVAPAPVVAARLELDRLLAQVPAGAPSCAVIDLDAIRDNTAAMRERAGDARVIGVVKADAYGHGMVPCARAMLDGGAAWLGVAQLSEALTLRAAGVDTPVLAWLTVPGDRFAQALAAGIDVGVGALWTLDELATAATDVGRPARVHLKVDTGLGRGGAARADWPALVERALAYRSQGTVEIVGVWSHLACADEPAHPSVPAQVREFTQALEFARQRGVRPELVHLANSAGLVGTPSARFDAVRLGISLYGVSPMPDLATPEELGLRAAMTLVGRLALVKPVPAGQGVSYGLTYTTDRPTTLGLVPLGYADGLPRQAGGCGPVLVAGRRRRVAGRVSMDQVVIDLDGDPARAGDLAVLFGDGRSGEPTAQDWAVAAGTIGYEIVTRIGARVPRVHVRGVTGG